MDRALVLIGVHDTGGLDRLPAVGTALDRMREWSRSQGFEASAVRELNDLAGRPVRAAEVFDAVASLSSDENLRQLIIYFCGHGMVTEGELWLLSGAPGNPNEAVNVPMSVRNAERGRVPHVVLVSDACRTATAAIQPGSVTGSIIFPNVPSIGPTQNVDLFYAAGAGAAGNQVTPAGGDGTFQSVFTEVLADGLAGVNVEVERVTDAGGTFDLVRPRPLLTALRSQVGIRLTTLGHYSVVQVPDGRITSDGLAWLSRLDPLPDDDRRGPDHGPDSGLAAEPIPTDPRHESAQELVAGLLENVDWPDGLTGAGLLVRGTTILEAVGGRSEAENDGPSLVRMAMDLDQTDMVTLRLENSSTSLPLFRDLVGVATFDEERLVDVTYLPADPHEWPSVAAREHRAWVGAAAYYGLEWWEDLTPDELLHHGLEQGATDPSYALHVAYALVDRGRRDLVPQLLAGPRPPLFDVALLAEQFDGPTAGTFPLLSRGWSLLGPVGVAARPDLPPRLPSPYSIFEPDSLNSLLDQLHPALPTEPRRIMRTLVFVHGRSQQGKDPKKLKAEWIDSLHQGLANAGLSLDLPDDMVRFPFYGDVLDHLWKGKEGDAPDVVVMGQAEQASEQERAFFEGMVRDLADTYGITDEQIEAEVADVVVQAGIQNWKSVLAVLRILDRIKPLGTATLAAATTDVYHYLNNPGIQTRIETGVLSALEGRGECVVVGHSLGSVVAYDVISRAGASRDWSVPTYITIGSPLAVGPVKQRLRPLARPSEIATWFNAYDPQDVVSLHPLTAAHFPVTPEVENFGGVKNTTSNHHGITGYLSDPTVARRIHEALTE